MELTSKIELFDADSLEYAGSIEVRGEQWNFADVKNDYLIEITKMMPLKGLLSSLINFNIVYDIIEINGDDSER